MSRRISSVLDIKPGSKKWTVLVQIVENGHRQISRSKTEYRKLMLCESEGTTVTAMIYNHDVRYYACLLEQYKRYYISNANVSENDSRYGDGAYKYYWTLTNRTLVEELVEPIPTPLSCHFEFTRFSDLYKYADSDTILNVRAVYYTVSQVKTLVQTLIIQWRG